VEDQPPIAEAKTFDVVNLQPPIPSEFLPKQNQLQQSKRSKPSLVSNDEFKAMMKKPSLASAGDMKGLLVTSNFDDEPKVGQPIEWEFFDADNQQH
jgi:hypothetical protein